MIRSAEAPVVRRPGSRRPRVVLPVAVVALVLGWGAAPPAQAASPDDNAALEAELEATERAFARTMADRDLRAFASYLADETIFFGSGGPLRGKAAVEAGWARYFEGPAAPFSWSPDVVAVLDSGTLGLTSGPVLDPEGRRIGTFNSVWRREDGAWRIVLDKGCPPCAP